MPKTYELTPRAERDLKDIWLYTAEHGVMNRLKITLPRWRSSLRYWQLPRTWALWGRISKKDTDTFGKDST